MIVFVALVEILIHIWTATHNIPLLSGGIEAELRPIGILAAVTGEVFSVGMLIFAWLLSGSQRTVALFSHVVMLAVLILNSMVNYAQVIGQTMSEYVDLYATYGAPTVMFIVAAAGCWLLAHQDPLARIRDAKLRIMNVQLDAKIASIRAVEQEMTAAMNAPENAETIAKGAAQMVRSATQTVAGELQLHQVSGNGSSPKP